MWTYEQKTGILRHDGDVVGVGYSGRDQGKNAPLMQDVQDVGPIPRGQWSIGPVFDSQEHGPICMRLSPENGTDTFGRAGFLIHGDSFSHPGEASHGCIVLPRPVRIEVAGSSDKDLEVV